MLHQLGSRWGGEVNGMQQFVCLPCPFSPAIAGALQSAVHVRFQQAGLSVWASPLLSGMKNGKKENEIQLSKV